MINGLNSDSKLCKTCSKVKLKTEFWTNGTTPKGTQKYRAKCKDCHKGSGGLEKVLKVKTALAELNREYKCEECGYNKNYAALNFHHINPLDKSFAISEKSSTVAINTLIEEIKKCAILCANCHAEEHNPGLINSV